MSNGETLNNPSPEQDIPEIHYEDVLEILAGFRLFPEMLEDYSEELRAASPENFDKVLEEAKEKEEDLLQRFPDVYHNRDMNPYGRYSVESFSLPSFMSVWKSISHEDRQEILDAAASVFRGVYGDDGLVELLYPVGELRSVEEYLDRIDDIAERGNDPNLTTQGYSKTR